MPPLVPMTAAQLTSRLLAMVPEGWASGTAKQQPPAPSTTQGVLWSLMNSLGQPVSWHMTNTLAPAFTDDRLAFAQGIGIDNFAADFFGSSLGRRSGESDAAYRARIQANLLLGGVTRAAISAGIQSLTGLAPRMIEPWRLADTGCMSGQLPVAQIGTPGTTIYVYCVVCYGNDTTGHLDKNQALATYVAMTATGNATLTGSNYNQITLTGVPSNTIAIDVFRLTAPSGTGKIASSLQALVPFNDQGGAPIPGGVAPSRPCLTYFGTDTSSTPGRYGASQGAACSVTVISTDGSPATGSTACVYRVAALDGASQIRQVMEARIVRGGDDGSVHYNRISWNVVSGAIVYVIYRVAGGYNTAGFIGQVNASTGFINPTDPSASGLTFSFDDNFGGAPGDGSLPPSPGGMPWQGLIDFSISAPQATEASNIYGMSPPTSTPTNPAFWNGAWFCDGTGSNSGGAGSDYLTGYYALASRTVCQTQDVLDLIKALRAEGTTIWFRYMTASVLAAETV